MKKILILLILIIIPGVIYLIFDISRKGLENKAGKLSGTDNAQVADEDGIVPDSNHQVSYSAWIPNWGSTAGFESLKKNSTKFQSISPVWFEVKDNGELSYKLPINASEVKQFILENEIELIPAIAMFDHELFSKVLNDESNLERHIQSIVDLVNEKGYHGIDLDYESTKLKDKQKYEEFIKELGSRLHDSGKKLIVTVLAKWGDDIAYPSLPETRQVQDWEYIAKHADEIRIMAYDFTFQKSTNPGPIAPLSWIRMVLDYAVTKIPREKISLGVHLYSYEWWKEQDKNSTDTDNSLSFIANFMLNMIRFDDKSARSYTYSKVKEVLDKYPGSYEEFDGEMIYHYQKAISENKVEKRVLVYIDTKGIQSRIDLGNEYNIKSLCFWRLGDESDLLEVL